jgi:hypothetical protein
MQSEKIFNAPAHRASSLAERKGLYLALDCRFGATASSCHFHHELLPSRKHATLQAFDPMKCPFERLIMLDAIAQMHHRKVSREEICAQLQVPRHWLDMVMEADSFQAALRRQEAIAEGIALQKQMQQNAPE